MKRSILIFSLTMLLVCLATMPSYAESGPAEARTRFVVISDIHLGADGSFAEFHQNKPLLKGFLQQLNAAPDVAELVIAGDLFDHWFLPMNYVMPPTLAEFNDRVANNNREIVDAINAIIQAGKIRVTYVPGNHDILFNAVEVARIFPGIHQARDTEGLGVYLPLSAKLAIEHGHRYNIFCAPDTFSNTAITGGKSIMPPGYFFTRIATSSVVEGKPKSANVFPAVTPNRQDATQMGYYYYAKVWQGLLTSLPVSESFAAKTIKTGIDGYNQPYAVNDLLPYQDKNGKITVDLYRGIVENWQKRQVENHVRVPFAVDKAILGAEPASFTDEQAQTQYFDQDPVMRVVVFGHTHEARIIAAKNRNGASVVYANSGTWIDKVKGFPTATYVDVNRDPAAAVITVSLYQYQTDGSSTLLQQEQLSE